jgi:tRNA threonylcarbamoyladenosine biosynthesis protein TsaB
MVPDLSAIDAYAISIGPGSFTGLRIGIAFMKGLAAVHRVPAIPISSLEILATQLADAHPAHELFLPMIDARKGDVFAGLYRSVQRRLAIDPRLPDGVYPANALDAIEGAIRGDPTNAIPTASVLGRIAHSYLPGRAADALRVEPAYLQGIGPSSR